MATSNDPILARYRFEWSAAKDEGVARDMARILKDTAVHLRRHYGLDQHKAELTRMCNELDDLIKDGSRKDFLAAASAVSYVKSRLQNTGTVYAGGLTRKPDAAKLREIRRICAPIRLRPGDHGAADVLNSEFIDPDGDV
jgi:hypothetical protein